MKRKKLVLLFSVLILCFVFVSCTDSVNLDQELIFEISTNKTIYRINEEINVKMVLRYQGVEPILVNSRLIPTPQFSGSPGCLDSVYFIIKNPLGKILHFRLKIRFTCPKPEDFVILSNGEEIIQTQRLENIFDFGESGVYTIQSIYNNAVDHPDGKEAWKGSIESNVISIEITP